jgi:[ribosomal protein S5]-alanine N-acetyltransferase
MANPWQPPTVETARLVLRPITEADAGAVFAACSLPDVTRFTLFDTHRSIDDSLNFIRLYVAHSYAEMLADPFAVALKSDPHREMVGAIGCHWTSRPHATMELGYWLAKFVWGRGVATEAADAVVRFAFANYPVERIQARTIHGNDASSKVLEKVGFRREGVLRSSLFRRGKFEDVTMFSLLRSELPPEK